MLTIKAAFWAAPKMRFKSWDESEPYQVSFLERHLLLGPTHDAGMVLETLRGVLSHVCAQFLNSAC
jgi:hypothetical protein